MLISSIVINLLISFIALKGFPSENEFKLFFGTLRKIIEIKLKKREYQVLLENVYKEYDEKRFEAVLENLGKVKKFKVDSASNFYLGLIEVDCLLEIKDKKKAKKLFFELEKKGEFSEEIKNGKISEFYTNVKKRIEDDSQDDEFTQLSTNYEKNPEDLDICLSLARKAKELEKYQLAIQLYLKIIEKNKNFKEKKPIEELKEIFEILGSSNHLVKSGRKELSMLLF